MGARELTQRQKVIEVQRKIKYFVKDVLEPALLNEAENLILDEQAPDRWYNLGDNNFYTAVTGKFLRDQSIAEEKRIKTS